MNWLKCNWQTLIFNIIETVIIFLIGIALRLSVTSIIFIMLLFMISRGVFGKALHFKTWYRCLLWSTLIMLSIFLLLGQDISKSIIFGAYLMTGKADIKDMYLWNNRSKYNDITEFIKNNESNKDLVEFENKIKTRDGVEYLIYKYKFKEGKTFKEMNNLLDMENPRIVEHLDKIAYAIRVYCNI